MALRYSYAVATGSVALSAAATKSLWLLDPATRPITIAEFSVSFDASASSTAIRVDLYVVTTLGSPTGSTPTPAKFGDQVLPAATTTAITALSAEPTTVSVLRNWFVQPFGGILDIQFPLDREPGADATATTNRLGLRCVTPTGVSPNAVADVVFIEN